MASLSTPVGRAFYGRFQELRAVQRDAVGPVLAGADVLVLSPTGSGKTEAVLAPLIQKHLPAARVAAAPVLLWVTPTRALANDLLRRIEEPLEALGLLAGIRHGERNDLQRASKPHVLITTPESLDVMLTAREPALTELRAIVLDEVHLTYNTQRGLQLGILLERLEQTRIHPLQLTALSATVATDAEIWHFLRPGRDFVTVRDPYSRPIDAQIRLLGDPADLGVLLEELSARAKLKALVFAGSRRECDGLAAALSVQPGLDGRVFVHHSSLSRDLRLHVEREFQEIPTAVCVATSTLELGIDIGDVDIVVLYGPPDSWESFIQRIGRGNRRGDKANVLCLAVPGRGRSFAQLLSFESLIWQVRASRMEQRPPMNLYGAAVQQVLTLVLERGGGYSRISELAQTLSPWDHLSSDVVERILSSLVESDHLRAHGLKNRVGAGEALHQLRDLGAIWGNSPSGNRHIPIRTSARELGTVPATNLARIRPGVLVRFGGRHWRVRRVGREGIEVETPRGGGEEIQISYGGHRPPLDPTIVEGMLLLLRAGIQEPQMPPPTAQWFGGVANGVSVHLKEDVIPFAFEAGRYLYFTFAGQLMNEVIALHARSNGFRAGEVVLESVDPIDFAQLPHDPRHLLPLALSRLEAPEGLTVFQQLLPAPLLATEQSELWLKSAVHARSLRRLRGGRPQQVGLKELDEINF